MDETKKPNADASHWRRVKLKVGFMCNLFHFTAFFGTSVPNIRIEFFDY